MIGPSANKSNTSIGVRIAGTGIGMPARTVSNEELAKTVDTTDEWIAQRTGIRTRHLVQDGETARTLATAALAQALDHAGIPAGELDMVISGTLTPEMCTPSDAARIVADLGAKPAGAVDISAACSGFVYGLNMGSALIQTGMYRNVGVIGAETLSKLTNWDDRTTCILFGDGAGAAVLAATGNADQGCLYQRMSSDGEMWSSLYCPRDETNLPVDSTGFTGKFNTLQMNGREVFKFAVVTLQRAIDDALNACDVKVDDLAMVIPHQSNIRMIESARQRLGLPEDRMYVNIDRYGNTSAASVAICLHELVEQKRLHEGDLVLFVAIGGGMTWATSLWRL
jgi:3-oxoacyl-[acyl-carrier-protein] synthase-3